MDLLVIARPRDNIDLQALPMMLQAGKAWYERYRDRMRAFGLFPGGGGFGVVSVDDSASLYRMMAEMPFSPVSDIEVLPFTPGAEGFDIAHEVFAGVLQAMPTT